MIIANLDHEDVTPLDEATSYQRLLDKGRTVDELAARLGKSKRYVYQEAHASAWASPSQVLRYMDDTAAPAAL